MKRELIIRSVKAVVHAVLRLVPDPMGVLIARGLAEVSPAVSRAIRTDVFAGSFLEHPRFSSHDVRAMVKDAKRRFKGASLFILSDVSVRGVSGSVPVLSDPSMARLERGDNVFIVAFQSDEKLIQVLGLLQSLRRNTERSEDVCIHWLPVGVAFPPSSYFNQNDTAYEVLCEERSMWHGKFDLLDFEGLIQAAEITRKVEGDYVEIGVYKGDSAHCLLSYMRRAKIYRKCWLLDTYEGFDYEKAKASGDKVWQGSHRDTSIAAVKAFLSDFENAHCLKSNIICDELPESTAHIALCNIDVDMYEAVLAAVIKVSARMVKNGIIILEDPGHTPLLAGARLALSEFMQMPESLGLTPVYLSSGQTFLIRTGD
jgi:hypothetical protein